MTSNMSQDVNNEAQIRALIERWAKAVREENRAGIRMDQAKRDDGCAPVASVWHGRPDHEQEQRQDGIV